MLSLQLQHRRAGVSRMPEHDKNPLSNTGTLGTLQKPAMISRTTACLLIWVTQSQDVPEHAYQTPPALPENTKRGEGWSRRRAPPCARLAPPTPSRRNPAADAARLLWLYAGGGRRPPPTARPLVTKRGETFVYVLQLCFEAMFYSIQFYLLTSSDPYKFAAC